MVRVVIVHRTEPKDLLILGDWFCSESIVPRTDVSYRQTMFSWHAPTVLKKLWDFDDQFASVLTAQGLTPHASLDAAIAQLQEGVEKLRVIE
jgi:hypothetical protein